MALLHVTCPDLLYAFSPWDFTFVDNVSQIVALPSAVGEKRRVLSGAADHGSYVVQERCAMVSGAL